MRVRYPGASTNKDEARGEEFSAAEVLIEKR